MSLDTYSALVLLAYAMMLLPLGVLIGQPAGTRRLPLKLYVAAGILIAVAIGLWSLRGKQPDILTFGFANTVFVFGLLSTTIALRAELGFPWPRKRWILLPVLFVVAYWLLGYLGIPRGGEILVKGSVWVCQLVMAYSCAVMLHRHLSRNILILFLVFALSAAVFSVHLFSLVSGDARTSVYPFYILWYMPLLILVATCVANIGFLGLVLENEHTIGMVNAASRAEEESRSRMAEVLAQMDRSSNLNVISASLGLQLSQPLAAIQLNAQLLQKRMRRENATSGELVDGLEQVIAQVRNCADIVDQVRQFIKPPALNETLSDLQQLTREVWDLLRQEAQQKGVQVEFPPELSGMYGTVDRLRTSQVLMNFFRSGSESLQLGASGNIRLRFRKTIEGVDVVMFLPWPQPESELASALAVRLQAHAVVFQSRLTSARATLLEFGASISVRETEPNHRELILHFLGSRSPAGESKMERA
jgi:signal transduction histidine kinase